MTDSSAEPALVEVHIVEMPVDVYREASEHGDELMREFALIRERDPDDGVAVPRRLQELVDQLTGQYSGFTAQQEQQLRDAVERGVTAVELTYRVPPDVKGACMALDGMLDEADEFCRQGKDLLTLATPPRAVAFRKWFLNEFVRQVDGQPPSRWQEPPSA